MESEICFNCINWQNKKGQNQESMATIDTFNPLCAIDFEVE